MKQLTTILILFALTLGVNAQCDTCNVNPESFPEITDKVTATGKFVYTFTDSVEGKIPVDSIPIWFGGLSFYGSIAELQSDSSVLEIGDEVTMQGYYSRGDHVECNRLISSVYKTSSIPMGVGKYANIVNNGTVDVRWLGAKGDGLSDDSPQIQAAVDNFTHIYFPDGIYMVYNTITLTGNATHITSEGAIMKRGALVTMIQSSTQLIVEKMQFDGNFSILDAPNTTPLIQINKSGSIRQRVSFSMCTFKDSRSSFILVNEYEYDMSGDLRRELSINNNYFESCTSPALIFYRTTYLSVSENYFSRCYTGIVMVESANSNIVNNRILKVGNTAYTPQYLGVSGGKGCFLLQSSSSAGNNGGKHLISNNTANHLRGRFVEIYQVASTGALDISTYVTNNALLSYNDELNLATPDKIRIFGAAKVIIDGNYIEGQTSTDILIESFGAFNPKVTIKDNYWIKTGVNISDLSSGTVNIIDNAIF